MPIRQFNRPWARRIREVGGLVGLLVVFAGGSAQAQNLVTNGNFANVGSYTQSFELTTANNLPGWITGNSSGIACVMVGGVNNMCGSSYTGPPNNTEATLAVFPGASPAGGNMLVGDAANGYYQSISQTITGLTVGASYTLSFYQAGAEQSGYPGNANMTEQWQVTFGGSTQDSTVMNVPQQGDVPWESQMMNFTATATSQTLSFMAVNGPSSLPPMALVDGIYLQVPEPASIALLGVGITGLAGLRRWRARRKV